MRGLARRSVSRSSRSSCETRSTRAHTPSVGNSPGRARSSAPTSGGTYESLATALPPPLPPPPPGAADEAYARASAAAATAADSIQGEVSSSDPTRESCSAAAAAAAAVGSSATCLGSSWGRPSGSSDRERAWVSSTPRSRANAVGGSRRLPDLVARAAWLSVRASASPTAREAARAIAAQPTAAASRTAGDVRAAAAASKAARSATLGETPAG
jgi:hypothetical protein